MAATWALFAAAALTVFTAADVAADPVRLTPGSHVVFAYNSAVLGTPVADATLALDPTGTFLTADVRVLPPNTFLQTVGFIVEPAVLPTLVQFTGYRDVSIVPQPGFTFAIQFGGDPGLRGGGPLASVLATFATPQNQLLLGPTSAFVYGFRGNQILQDEAVGAVVPEPGTVSLLTLGLAMFLARRRHTTGHFP